MDRPDPDGLLSPPTSVASPATSTSTARSQNPTLPTPRSHRLPPGSQKEIALINYLDDRILRITRRYAKKFSNEGLDRADTPGYTTYDQFVDDADPLLDVVWVSGTRKFPYPESVNWFFETTLFSLATTTTIFTWKYFINMLPTREAGSILDFVLTSSFLATIQIPYLLSLAGFACSYMQAFPFSTSVFYVTSKIDQGFASLLRASEGNDQATASVYQVSMTEKVRIKSLIEETRIAAVHAASADGLITGIQEVSEIDTEEEDIESSDDDDADDGDQSEATSISLSLSKIYKRTLEILGDSLVVQAASRDGDDDIDMS